MRRINYFLHSRTGPEVMGLSCNKENLFDIKTVFIIQIMIEIFWKDCLGQNKIHYLS